MTITRHEFVERVERRVLNALDQVVEEVFGQARHGWSDGELLALMPAVYRHASRVYRRMTIHEPEPTNEP